MRRWSKEVAGTLEERLKRGRRELEICMKEPVSESKIREDARLRGVVEDLEEKINIKMKQRSHMSWLKDGNGNTNTRYYTAIASGRKRANRVKWLRKEDGSVVKEGEEMTN